MNLKLFFHISFLILFLTCTPSDAANMNDEKPMILVIDSYHSGYFWTQEYRAGLEDSLKQCCQITYFEMDTKRTAPEKFIDKANEAKEKIMLLKPQGIILADDNAVKYLVPYLSQTKIPVSFLGVNENPREYLVGKPENITGVLGRTPYKRNISLIKHYLRLDKAKILVLFDNSLTAKAMFEGGFGGKSIQSFSESNVEIRLISTLKEWRQAIQNAPNEGFDAISLMLYHRIENEHGTIENSESILNWTAQNSVLPIFGIWKFSLNEKNGAIGGLLAGGFEQGYDAGQLLKNMVFNKKRNIPPKTALEGKLTFSLSQLKKWNISLPEDILSKSIMTK